MPRASSSSSHSPNTTLHIHTHALIGTIRGLTYFSPSSSSSTTFPSTPKPTVHYYSNIPYALPPTGPHRFHLPRPLSAGHTYGNPTNPADFTGLCPVCPQPSLKGGFDEKGWDEDCLRLRIWIPAGTPPKGKGGWPVLVYLHGGFLQFGTANSIDPVSLLSDESGWKGIVVAVNYRVNLFGFLCSQEVAFEDPHAKTVNANFGFHDQRLAVLWISHYIAAFGGNASQLTLAGHSAGAHSAFHQLAHELYLPPSQRLIKRVLLLSNGAGMQPKTIAEAQGQFDALLRELGIPHSLSASEKMARLRSLPARTLLEAAEKLDLHEFRACSDASPSPSSTSTVTGFINPSLFTTIHSGHFRTLLRDSGVQVVIGEVSAEHHVYATWRPPKLNSLEGVRKRLYADYNAAAVDALVALYCADGKLPLRSQFVGCSKDDDDGGRGRCGSWKEVFGRLYADLQVHATSRGFLHSLLPSSSSSPSPSSSSSSSSSSSNPNPNIRRYRIEWRAHNAPTPKPWGSTHGTDVTGIWLFGNGIGKGLTEDEKKVVREFARPVWRWISGEGWGGMDDWAVGGGNDVRVLIADGRTVGGRDEMWEKGVQVWDVIRRARERERRRKKEVKARL